MKGITIKLPDSVARQLREQARQSGRSIAALIRERIEVPPRDGSVYAERRSRRESGRPPGIGNERPPKVPASVITICDPGPLLAYLNRNDPHHEWPSSG